MERRKFFKRLGIGAAAVAVVPVTAIKAVLNTIPVMSKFDAFKSLLVSQRFIISKARRAGRCYYIGRYYYKNPYPLNGIVMDPKSVEELNERKI